MKKSDFKDIDLKNVTGITKAHVRLSRFFPRFQRAQLWLDRQIMKDMEPYVPYRTGVFLGKIKAQNEGYAGQGKIVLYVPPQGRMLYSGLTGYGKPIHYTNPLTTPRWFTTVKNIYQVSWIQGVRREIWKGGKR